MKPHISDDERVEHLANADSVFLCCDSGETGERIAVVLTASADEIVQIEVRRSKLGIPFAPAAKRQNNKTHALRRGCERVTRTSPLKSEKCCIGDYHR
jgi:hypothetical protein